MENKIYEKLQEPIRDLNELKISVDYTLGGMNYFSGGSTKRGVYLYLSPVSRCSHPGMGGVESSVLMGGQRESGFKICLEELTRKSQKKIDAQFDRIKGLSKEIAGLYYDGKNQEIFNLVTAI